MSELASGSGDLTKEIDIHTGDELEVIAENMNVFIAQVRTLVRDVARSTGEISTSLENLNMTTQRNAHSSEVLNEQVNKYTF